MSKHWTVQQIPDLSGKVIIVTGANSGLGYESTLALADHQATVIMACRNQERADAARERILQQIPSADVRVMLLDLADLNSVKQFAETVFSEFDRLDVLMNNAGVMGIPYRETPQGYETQFAVNHLGHFALTGHLLPLLLKTPDSRIVTVSSNMHWFGSMHFDDLNLTNNYNRWSAYCQSKLANILFTRVLNQRLQAIDSSTMAVTTHPGYAETELQTRNEIDLWDWLVKNVMNPLVAQSSAQGALPQLYAAVADDVVAGGYYGPHLLARGYPTRQKPNANARNNDHAVRLWQQSVEMTGMSYEAFSLLSTSS